MLTPRCPHCGGNLAPDYDPEVGTFIKCLQCGREPRRKETATVERSNGTAVIRGLEALDLSGNGSATKPHTPDSLDEYTAAARLLLDLVARHKATLATAERLQGEIAEARRQLDDARTRLDMMLGEAVPINAVVPAEAKPAKPCRDCGAPAEKGGRCLACHRKKAAEWARKSYAKAHGTEVSA